MTIGKAEAHTPERAAKSGHDFKVPCFTSLDDEEAIRDHLARDHFLWLDLTAPGEDELDKLREIFDFHPLALEDAREFGQRPKLDHYGAYVLMVFYGALEGAGEQEAPLREVLMFISGRYLVTIHEGPLPAIEMPHAQLSGMVLHSEQFLLYRVFDGLTDSFFPLLAQIDDEIDELESAILVGPTDSQLQRLFALKRQLVAMRKVVTPQRDLFARNVDQIAELDGLQLDERDYFRDVYDHLIRISDLIDSYRDLLSGATDLYLSTVSNRQNEVMKQLATVGTVFLPLSFITGFFGMNFGWLVNKGIAPAWTFVVFGFGSLLVSLAISLAYFKRKHWI